MSSLLEPAYFHTAPEYRRCAIYPLIALPLGLAVLLLCSAVLRQLDPHAEGLGTGIFVGFTLLLALLGSSFWLMQLWALRLDGQGIAQRGLLGWYCWSWGDFASGRLRKVGWTLIDPERPWWRRRLSLEFLTEADRKQLMTRINEHYQLPPPSDVGEVLTIHAFVHRFASFDRHGIRLTVRRMSFWKDTYDHRAYPWEDARRLHITRLDPARRNFVSLELTLPDQEIVWRRGASWQGVSPEGLEAFLRRHIEEDRIEVDIEGERPARRIDLENKLTLEVKKRREFRQALWIPTLMAAALLIFMALNSIVGAALLAAVLLPLLGLLWWGLERMAVQRLRRLREELAAYRGEAAINDKGPPAEAGRPLV